MTNALLTGSHAYGIPRPLSDVDVVIRGDRALVAALEPLAGAVEVSDPGADGVSLRFGRLNLIVALSDAAYAVWARGTAELMARAPVNRSEAIAHFKALRLGVVPR